MNGLTLGIIGTAGRGPDGVALKGYWKPMCTVAQVVCEMVGVTELVSGGAAWADHIAVRLYLDGQVDKLTLHLAAEFTPFGFKETSSRFDCGRTSNHYHYLFSHSVGQMDSLVDIQSAIEKGAIVKSGAGGFKERNTDVANQADVMLGFTFGDGPFLKDGGTKDTMDKYLNRRRDPLDRWVQAPQDNEHWRATCGAAYHFDLNSKRLYTL